MENFFPDVDNQYNTNSYYKRVKILKRKAFEGKKTEAFPYFKENFCFAPVFCTHTPALLAARPASRPQKTCAVYGKYRRGCIFKK